jgi:hypothetical protein
MSIKPGDVPENLDESFLQYVLGILPVILIYEAEIV